MENLHDRIIHLRRQANLTQKEFAEVLGVSQAYVSSLESGKREASRTILNGLIERFKVSPTWLLQGEGPLHNHSSPDAPAEASYGNPAPVEAYWAGAREQVVAITVDAANEPNIVLVPVKAQAGYALQRVEPTYLQDLPVLSLPDARFRHGTFRAFEVSGDSMEPTLFGNDIVVCRYVQDWRWLRDRELYVAVLREDVLVKRITNRLREGQVLELESDNRFYPPLRVPATEVVEVWQVVARITQHLPSPRQGT